MDRGAVLDKHFASRVDWNLLRTFVEIVRAGGIGAAARKLHKQQPSISAALKRLEEQVGVQLLERSPTGIKTTAWCRTRSRRRRGGSRGRCGSS